MEEKNDPEKVYKKGFRSGKELRNVLYGTDKANQLDGIAYRLLNDLKICNKESFYDTYIRLMMSHQLPIALGKQEMLDSDTLLQFGYAFMTGLLAANKNKGTESEPETTIKGGA